MAYDEDSTLRATGGLLALLITYVDDLFYLAERPLVEALHAWVQQAWPCSSLEWADSEQGARYLGMEIKQVQDGSFELSQQGYIRELLRSYNLEEALETKLPCPREWLAEHDGSEEENFTANELRLGQKAVGEQLWLMMRCRPDIQFPVAFMASKVSKQPNRVVQIARRLLTYLKATASMRMVIGGKRKSQPSTIPELTAWSDASFAPTGEKSFGASVVTVNGDPVAWKASKQAFVTLSVMEAELLEASTATVLLENIGCLLDELVGERVDRRLLVDNASAVSMITGGPGSWRTRHLKVRSAKIREQVETNELLVEHVGGAAQLADLATKMHPKVRLWELLLLWGFKDLPKEAGEALQMKAMYMTCLILAMMCQPASADEESEDLTKAAIPGVGFNELLVVTVVVCIATVGVWEMLKWLCRRVIGACSESPKQKRLRKLREAARAAAEEEVDRAVLSRVEEPPEPHYEPRPVTRRAEPMYTTGATFEAYPHDGFYKTDSHRSKLHTSATCYGLRNGGTVYKTEYCAYCAKKSRSLH